MTRSTDPGRWTPAGVAFLEAAADRVVRSEGNFLVVAGPGAGKTELLAQKASFLLETGLCSGSRRILAISFKRDAAKNLRERVHDRNPALSARFDSLTLDAFAKGLVDRFSAALPKPWRPNPGYEVSIAVSPYEIADWLDKAGAPAGTPRIDVNRLPPATLKALYDDAAHGHPLPLDDSSIPELDRFLASRFWRERLQFPEGSPSLTFPMLNRLAALVLRSNPKIKIALQGAYPYVFVDEFQDTTGAQYDLIRAAFLDSESSVTAVGDERQRIMLWAGALEGSF